MSTLAAVGIFFNMITWALLSLSDPATNQPVLAMVWFAVFLCPLDVLPHILVINILALSFHPVS